MYGARSTNEIPEDPTEVTAIVDETVALARWS